MRKSLLDKQQYEQLMIELMCQIMTKRKKKFPISWEEVSLSKCMAYSGRRDGLFNSHIWEYINLCVHTHIIYIPPSCGLDINLQTWYKIQSTKFSFTFAYCSGVCHMSAFSFAHIICLANSVAKDQNICWFIFLCLFFAFLTSFPPYVGLHWPPSLPSGTIHLYSEHNYPSVHIICQSLAVLTIYHKPNIESN